MTTPLAPYGHRIIRIADPRSRGACSWYEIERVYADGRRSIVAVCDDRREARELVRQIEAAEAARQAEAAISDPPGFELAPAGDDDDAIVLDACPTEAATIATPAYEARQALAAARAAAGREQRYRRDVAGRLGGDSWARVRDYSPSLVADRRELAHAIRRARAALKICS